MARILTSNRTVGRPGGHQKARVPFGDAFVGKLGIRRLMRRDPAKGLSTPAADLWSTTENVISDPSPTIISGSQRKKSGPSTKGKKVVPDKKTNRSIDVR